jgi:hypothetical protein
MLQRAHDAPAQATRADGSGQEVDQYQGRRWYYDLVHEAPLEQPMTLAEEIHRTALRQPASTIARSLQETIGQRLAAFGVGVRNPKLVGRWARGEHEPRQAHERALRELFQVVALLVESGETGSTVRAWLIGSNPQLEDRAPIEVFHEGAIDQVKRAAGAFVASG